MKKIIITFSIVSLGLLAAAQQSQYQSAMLGAITSLDKARTPDAYTQCANRFERIAVAEKSVWLPFYYASYSLIVMSFEEEDGGKKDMILDRAQELLDTSLELEPDESELHVLQAFLYPSRILVDPMSRGMQYMERIYASLAKAKILNPENPRIYFLEGVNKANLPPSMGGGPEVARPILEEAVAKFESFSNEDPLWPNWGEEAARTELEKLQ